MSRASFSICGSVASAAAISRGISTRPWTSLASSASDNSPRALPAATASAASTISWQVKALVEATPISGPGQRRQHGFAFARDGRGRHVDDGERMHALLFGVAQRRQRIGGLAGLRNEDRQIALAQRRLAVAEFGGDIEFDRQRGQPLEPVFGDVAGIARGAAGDDRDALDVLEVERQFERQRHPLGRHVDVARQRVADHFGLLVNFLGHEVAIVGLVDQRTSTAPCLSTSRCTTASFLS